MKSKYLLLSLILQKKLPSAVNFKKNSVPDDERFVPKNNAILGFLKYYYIPTHRVGGYET